VAIGDDKWEIYIGGAGGSHVRKGDVLCVVDDEDDVLLYTGRFIQFYRENAKYKERTYTFVERLGIERIRSVVVEDSEGLAAELDAAMQASVEAAYDPWKEGSAPKTPNQFSSVIPAECT
jgi:nitrite reductase (NADH) large subunit